MVGLNSNQPLEKIKEEFKKIFKPSLLGHPDLNSPKAATCKAIFISQLPFYLTFHVEVLIQLKSDFDINCGSYLIDVFKNSKNIHTGDCLLRFMKNKDCIQVFKDLQGIHFPHGPLIVNLDLDNKIAESRDRYWMKHYHRSFEEQLRKFNETRAKIVQSSERTDKDHVSGVKTKIKQENTEDDVQIIEPGTLEDANIKIEAPENLMDFENTTDIKQEANDELNTIEVNIKDEKIDIDKNTITETTQEEPLQSAGNNIPYHVLYQTCRIVHIKNLDKSKFPFFHKTLKEFIHKTMGHDQKFQFRKVLNEEKEVSGDVLLEFPKHRDAESVCRRLNSCALTAITAPGVEMEAVMGVGYKMKHSVSTTDLRLYQLKRKLLYQGNGENENKAKKAKVDTPMPRDDKNKGQDKSKGQQVFAAADKDNSNRGNHTNKEQQASMVTSRTASDYPTGVVTVDERDFTAFGLSKEFMHSLEIKMPFSRTVIVSRLHPDVNEAKLMEVFSLAGEVKKINFLPAKQEAKIEYDHALEAVQAISMLDKQKLYNRTMHVQMDEVPRKRTLPQGLAGVGQGLGKHGQPLRGCRIEAEIRRLHEMFVDLGKMEREVNDKTNAFKFRFNVIKPDYKNKTDTKSDKTRDTSAVESKSSSNKSSNSDSRNKSSSNNSTKPLNSSNSKSSESSSKDSKKNTKPDDAIPEGTLIAIQALGTVLVAQGLIPADTNCKSLQCILGALQRKTAAQQNLSNPNIDPTLNINANANPGRSDSLNQAINNVMQFMTSNNTPNQHPTVAPNIQNVTPIMPIANVNQAIRPVQVNPIPRPVHQGNIQPVAPYEALPQSRWDIMTRPGNPSLPFSLGHPSLPTPVRPELRGPDLIQIRPIQPKYDPMMTRPNLREVPTCVAILPQQIQQQQNMSSQQKPENVSDSSKEKVTSYTSASKKISIQSNQSLKKSEMLVFKDLPTCVTTDILKGKMEEVGELQICEMTGKGRAFVRFKNPEDADRCIRLFHLSKVDGQVIQVSFL